MDFYGIIGAILVGAVLAPVLLPWVPGRAFSLKGYILGLLWAVGFLLINGIPSAPVFGWLKAAAYFLLLPALSAVSDDELYRKLDLYLAFRLLTVK